MPFTVGQYLTKNDLDSQEDAHTLGYGVVNGLKVIPTAPPDMDIHVEIGKAYAADTLVEKGAVTDLTVTAADPTNPRKDIVVCNSAGTLSIVAGTPEAALPVGNIGLYTLNPEPDNIPANSIILAEIWVPAGATEITGSEICDKRVSIADFLTHKDATTGIHGVGVGTVAKVGDIAVDANLSVAGQDAITKRHTRSHDHSNALDGSPIAEAGVPTHMAKSKLAFTANKLLKGAGPTSDPTEIDVPAAGMPDDFANLSDAQKVFIMVYGI